MDPFTANTVASLLDIADYREFIHLWPEWWIDPLEKQARWEWASAYNSRFWKWPRTRMEATGTHRTFVWAIEFGGLHLVQWIYREFRPTIRHAKYGMCHAFRRAIGRGHLEVVQWLHREFPHTSEEVKWDNCYAFRYAFWNGHLETLKWLQDTFPHSEDEVRKSLGSSGALEIECTQEFFHWAQTNIPGALDEFRHVLVED